MKCDTVKNLLGWFHDGELSSTERSAVRAHLNGCAACTNALAALSQLDRASQLLSTLEPPADLWERLARKLPPHDLSSARAARGLGSRLRTLAAAAAALALLTSGLLGYRMVRQRTPNLDAQAASTDRRDTAQTGPERAVAANFAKLSPEDQRLALSQRLCASGECGNQLGADGPPVRLVLQDQHIFCCCAECERWALAHPTAALAKARQLVQAHAQDHSEQ